MKARIRSARRDLREDATTALHTIAPWAYDLAITVERNATLPGHRERARVLLRLLAKNRARFGLKSRGEIETGKVDPQLEADARAITISEAV